MYKFSMQRWWDNQLEAIHTQHHQSSWQIILFLKKKKSKNGPFSVIGKKKKKTQKWSF